MLYNNNFFGCWIDKNDIFVKICHQQLKRVEKIKYLGVIIDEGLKLNENLDYYI
jgi:hypothetical protein